ANHVPLTGWRAAVYRLRRLGIYPAFFYTLTHWILPTAIMWWLFWWLAFGTANTLGLFCTPTGHAIDVTEAVVARQRSVDSSDVFYTKELCHPTGPTDPRGFRLGAWRQLGGIPFKRLIWSNWFRPIIRVGSTGLEEHLPTLTQDPADKNLWSGEFTA